MKQVSLAQARDRLSALVDDAAHGRERIVLASRGRPRAALIGMEDLEWAEARGAPMEREMLLWIEQVEDALGMLLTMPVSLRAPAGLVERAWDIARELDRPTAYDCFYLGVAELLDIACWTADRRLFNAARTKRPWLRHLHAHQ
jgi:prevent-host-death family protein